VVGGRASYARRGTLHGDRAVPHDRRPPDRRRLSMRRATQTHRKALHVIVLAASLTLLVAGPARAASHNPNPGLVPHNAKYHGLTYGQWQARWQQWGLSIPATPDLPFFRVGIVLQG